MNRTPANETQAISPTVTAYLVIGFAALAMLGLALSQSGADRWSLVPTLIGVAGMVFRWRIAPLALISAVAFGIVTPAWMGGTFAFRRINSLTMDIVLCGSILVYLLAQFRLIGLQGSVLPPDPRDPKAHSPARDPATVNARETPTAMLVAVAATIGAFFIWELTALVPPMWGMSLNYWRVAFLVWILSLLLVATGSTVGYLGWRKLSRPEAMMILRDAYWRETRGEQRRINRWRAWARRKTNCAAD